MNELTFDEKGLIPAVVQNYRSGKVLMVAYMNQEAIDKTLQTGLVHFYSRSRSELWLKGETSGNYMHLVELRSDCDNDCLLVLASPDGPACHTNAESCFFNVEYHNGSYPSFDPGMLYRLHEIVRDRKENPKEGSYTNYLFDSGLDKILKKVGEESAETIIAAKNRSKEEIVWEASDLLYHLTVLFLESGVEWEDICMALQERHGEQ